MSLKFAIAGTLLFVAEVIAVVSYAARSEEMPPALDTVAAAPGAREAPPAPPPSRAEPEAGGIQVALASLISATAQEAPAPSREADILAQCMNGRSIALDDNEVMTCQIRRMKP